MRTLAIAVCATMAFANFGFSAPLENDAILTSEWTRQHAQTLASEASALIRRAGYKCDSISSLQRWVFSAGFDVVCNNFRYSYELEDKGGRWTVTLQ